MCVCIASAPVCMCVSVWEGCLCECVCTCMHKHTCAPRECERVCSCVLRTLLVASCAGHLPWPQSQPEESSDILHSLHRGGSRGSDGDLVHPVTKLACGKRWIRSQNLLFSPSAAFAHSWPPPAVASSRGHLPGH